MFSTKKLVLKLEKPLAAPESSNTKAFNPDIRPEVEVSQKISNLDSTGFVSKIANAVIFLYSEVVGITKLLAPNCLSISWEVVIWAIRGLESDL